MLNSTKLTLFLSLRSPFARRVRLALTRVGIAFDEEIVDVFHPPAHFLATTPLGLVPTLSGPGLTLSDSTMILEWAHQQTGSIYTAGPLEWRERQASVLCAGVIQSSVLFFQETKMHDAPSSWWTWEHYTVIKDTLAIVERMQKELLIRVSDDGSGSKLTQAGWDLAVALEYLSLRMPTYDWSKRHPSFNDLIKLAHQDAKFAATVPPA